MGFAVFLAMGGVDMRWGVVNEGWLMYAVETMLLLPMVILAGAGCGLVAYGITRIFTRRFTKPANNRTVLINLYLVGSCVAMLLGAMIDAMTWQYHWPVLTPDWLAHLVSADGEAGYDSLSLEYMIDVWLMFTAGVLLVRWRQRAR